VCENIESLHPISVMMGSGKIYRREFLKLEKARPETANLNNPSSKKLSFK
jgi:hypothetical protein